MTATKRKIHLPPPPGYIPIRHVLLPHKAPDGKPVSRQRWHQLLKSERCLGVWWDGYHWFAHPKRFRVLPGKK